VQAAREVFLSQMKLEEIGNATCLKRKREEAELEQDIKDREAARSRAEADSELLRELVSKGDADAKKVFLTRLSI